MDSLQEVMVRLAERRAAASLGEDAACSPNRCMLYGNSYEEKLGYCHKRDFDCPVLKQVYREQMLKSGILERFFDANFAVLEQRGIPPQFLTQYQIIRAYAENVEEHIKKGEGLYLQGDVGTMKTSLAVAVLQHYLKLGHSSCYFVPLASLLNELFSLQGEFRIDYERRLKECRLLVIDDLGQEYYEGWVMKKFETIIFERYNRLRSTIFTTNLSSKDSSQIYSALVRDRVNEMTRFVKFSGKSLRVPGGSGRNT